MIVVVLEEREQFETAEAASCVAIDSLESRVGREVSDLAKTLAEAFELAFTVTDSDEQIFESVF